MPLGPTAKGIHRYDNLDPMEGPAQMTQIADDVDALIDASKPNPAALPSSDNWPGRRFYVESDKSTRVWDGTGWAVAAGRGTPFAMAAGTTTARVVGANTSSTQVVTFPVGRFTVPPVVTASSSKTDVDVDPMGFIVVQALTAVGMTVRHVNPSANAQIVAAHWIAVQMSAS